MAKLIDTNVSSSKVTGGEIINEVYDDGTRVTKVTDSTGQVISNVTSTFEASNTLTGGNSTEITRTRSVYADNEESLAIRDAQQRLNAEKAAYRAELKDLGLSNGEILKDPNMQQYSDLQKQYRSDYSAARTVVEPGGVSVVTRDPNGNIVNNEFTPNRTTANDFVPVAQYANYPEDDPVIKTAADEAFLKQNEASAYDPEFDVFNVNPQDDPYFSAAQDELDFQAEINADLADAQLQAPAAQDPYEGTAMTDDEYEYAQADGIDPYEGTAMTDDEYPYDPNIVAAQQAYQRSVQDTRKPINKGDWRFRIKLSPFSSYLYNDPNALNGILRPLKETDGVIFPYTPKIDQTYYANYEDYNLTHSNYRGYFYQGSHNGDIIVNSMFTAQDTAEANYLLAVIHFFRSATKMFYGQDAERGTPPPLLYMSGLGEYQFNEHPCVLSIFNYNLPDEVDYIKCSKPGSLGATNNTQFIGRNDTGGYQSWSSKLTRLISSGLSAGAPPVLDNLSTSIQGITKIAGGETYVPTRINIALTFKPVQTRKQVSSEFSLKEYSTGDLLKKGFW